MHLNVPISPGELLDKLSILEIKSERIRDAKKLDHVRHELGLLRATWADSPFAGRDIAALVAELKRVNETLWDIEDRIRERESEGRFDEGFVELARAVYRTNDRRAAIKRELNTTLGSEIQEEKSYSAY
jgi:hypothetical protein